MKAEIFLKIIFIATVIFVAICAIINFYCSIKDQKQHQRKIEQKKEQEENAKTRFHQVPNALVVGCIIYGKYKIVFPKDLRVYRNDNGVIDFGDLLARFCEYYNFPVEESEKIKPVYNDEMSIGTCINRIGKYKIPDYIDELGESYLFTGYRRVLIDLIAALVNSGKLDLEEELEDSIYSDEESVFLNEEDLEDEQYESDSSN